MKTNWKFRSYIWCNQIFDYIVRDKFVQIWVQYDSIRLDCINSFTTKWPKVITVSINVWKIFIKQQNSWHHCLSHRLWKRRPPPPPSQFHNSCAWSMWFTIKWMVLLICERYTVFNFHSVRKKITREPL